MFSLVRAHGVRLWKTSSIIYLWHLWPFFSLWKGEATQNESFSFLIQFGFVISARLSPSPWRSPLANGINTIICGLNLILCDKSIFLWEMCFPWRWFFSFFYLDWAFENSLIESIQSLRLFSRLRLSSSSNETLLNTLGKEIKAVCKAYGCLSTLSFVQRDEIYSWKNRSWVIVGFGESVVSNFGFYFLENRTREMVSKKSSIGFCKNVLSTANGAWD